MRSLILCALTMLALTGCPGGDDGVGKGGGKVQKDRNGQAVVAPVTVDPNVPAVAGSVTVEGLEKVPPGVSLKLRLLDVTDPTTAPIVVAEFVQPSPGLLPHDFRLPYEPAALNPAASYAVDAALMADTAALYSVPEPIAVADMAATLPMITLTRGGRVSTDMSPGDKLKIEFSQTESQMGAMRRVAGSRIDEEVTVGWDAFADANGIRVARENVDLGEGKGTARYVYGFRNGKPWLLRRTQGGATITVGWDIDGNLILNEGDVAVDAAATLYRRAEAVYTSAAARA